MEKEKKISRNKIPLSLRFGAICIAFLVIGYQLALFFNRAAVLKIEAGRDAPDTVFVYGVEGSGQDGGGRSEAKGREGANRQGGRERNEAGGGRTVEKREARHSPVVKEVRESTRRVRNFRFNPNDVSIQELQDLGFSQKQAQAIENYRKKGGRFHSKADFARSFVVTDSVYHRLEAYIDIPLLDINKADSAAFDDLPGIGPYFAARMVRYREDLGGYSCPEQLLEIYNFGEERLQRIRGLIYCSKPRPFGLWRLDAAELQLHPHIKNYRTAAAIVLFRQNTPADCLSVAALQRAGIISREQARALSRCNIADAQTTD